MPLNLKSINLLRWFSKHPGDWFSVYDLSQNGINAESVELNWLYEQGCLLRLETDEPYNSDQEDPPFIYRIGPGGRAELESYDRQQRMDRRWYISVGLSVLSILFSMAMSVIK